MIEAPKSDTIIILGMHQPSLHKWNYRNSIQQGHEVWGLAHHSWTLEFATRAFESHSEPIVMKHGGLPHVRRLEKTASLIPLYTPWEWSKSLGKNHCVIPHSAFGGITKQFESSIAYPLAMAIWCSCARTINGDTPLKIELYGVDMAADSEYNYQRPNMQYLIGYARALNIPIYLPDNCSLFSSQWKGKLYGSPQDVDTIDYHLKPGNQEFYT